MHVGVQLAHVRGHAHAGHHARIPRHAGLDLRQARRRLRVNQLGLRQAASVTAILGCGAPCEPQSLPGQPLAVHTPACACGRQQVSQPRRSLLQPGMTPNSDIRMPCNAHIPSNNSLSPLWGKKQRAQAVGHHTVGPPSPGRRPCRARRARRRTSTRTGRASSRCAAARMPRGGWPPPRAGCPAGPASGRFHGESVSKAHRHMLHVHSNPAVCRCCARLVRAAPQAGHIKAHV